MFFRFEVQAHQARLSEHPRDTWEEYVAAYSYDHARQSLISRLARAGWTVDAITGRQIYIQDFRDHSDHVTD